MVRSLRVVGRLVVLVLGAVPGAPGQTSPRPAAAAPKPVTVAVVGASASAGFSDQLVTATTPEAREHNATLKLKLALTPLFAEGAVRVKDYSDVSMFLHAEESAERQVQRALRTDPDVVVALDFLFWFGYSIHGGDRAARLELQAKGLAALDRIDKPLLVGDYPGMRDIDPRMLHPRAIPDADTLAELNARLRQWAATRARVRVFPLDRLQATLRDEKRVVALGGERFQLDADDLLQTDRLHVTKLGMAVLVTHLTQALTEQLPGLPALRPEVHTLAEVIGVLDLADAVRQQGTRVATEPVPAGGSHR